MNHLVENDSIDVQILRFLFTRCDAFTFGATLGAMLLLTENLNF
jgi:hypothetical protein